MLRIPILKTYKLFIGGQFLRTESGRFYQLKNKKNLVLANVCLSSRKDYKNAVVSARQAFSSWSQKSAFNRGQILYRIAEMLEGRKEQFINELVLQGITLKKSREELDLSIDALVYYAGWCDKYQALFSSVNPVASSHFNFSVPEPTGLVSVIAPTETGVLGLISVLAPIIAGGNTCVVLASEKLPLCAITFAEVIAYVSRDETLEVGDFFGSGPPAFSVGFEIDRWVKPGDVMECEIEGIGTLSNPILRK